MHSQPIIVKEAVYTEEEQRIYAQLLSLLGWAPVSPSATRP